VRVAPDRLFAGAFGPHELCATEGIDAVLIAGAFTRRAECLAATVAAGKAAYLLAP